MRFGRLLRAGDQLFGAGCEISPGAVILQRTDTDDYVRMRVPDTNCPPLPEPDRPLDSGVADEAEPYRWEYSGTYRPESIGWWFGPNHDDNLNFVRPSYKCYEGNFVCFVRCSWGGPFGLFSSDFFGLLLPEIGCGIGIGGILFPGELEQPATYAAYQQNGSWTVWNLAYATINAGQPVWLFLIRAGTTIYGGFSRIGPEGPEYQRELAYGVSGPVLLSVGKDFIHYGDPGMPHRPLGVAMSQWGTQLGAPTEIWVQTPVVDVGQPRRVLVRGLPKWAQLVWRAGNDLPLPDYWDNPVGEYRYWQAKLQTSSSGVLLERIEFGNPMALEAVWLRNRFIWLVRTNKNPVVVPFKPVAWGHRVAEISPTAGGYEVTFLDAADEYSLLLEER
jgi:hypothetical protein